MEESSESVANVDDRDEDTDALADGAESSAGASPTEANPDDADTEESSRVDYIVESVLFAAAAPLSLRKLVEILDGPTSKEVQAALARLREQYGPGRRGIQLHEVAGGYQLRTARENAEWVRAIFRDKPARLGRAALETLAIIAYKQPFTRAELEAIRGVDVDGVVTTLLSRRLIKIAGRKEAVGRPLLYSTTPEFLEAFGLKDLAELPSLKELGPPLDAEEITTTAAPAPDGADAASAPDGADSEPPVLGEATDGTGGAAHGADQTSQDVTAGTEPPAVVEADSPDSGAGGADGADGTSAAVAASHGAPVLGEAMDRAAGADAAPSADASPADQAGADGQPAFTPSAGPPSAGPAVAGPSAGSGGEVAEDTEPGGDRVAAQGRGADRGRARAGKRPAGNPARDESEPADRSDHD